MYKTISTLVVMCAAIAAAPASAQDAQTFTGPRADVALGWDQTRFDLADYGSGGRGKATDLEVGGAVGYDVALTPMLVGGIEAGGSYGDATARAGTLADRGNFRRRRELDVAARLGVPVTGNLLLYGKVGYTNLQVRDTRSSAGVVTASNLLDLDGVLVGAGAEVKVSPRVFLTSEYRHADYARDYDSNQVTTGIGLRF